jgi:hypothetical protein
LFKIPLLPKYSECIKNNASYMYWFQQEAFLGSLSIISFMGHIYKPLNSYSSETISDLVIMMSL